MAAERWFLCEHYNLLKLATASRLRLDYSNVLSFALPSPGGSLAKILSDGLPHLKTDWSKWKVFFCDERHVPFDDPECTYSVYKKNLLSKVPILDEHVYPDNPNIPGRLSCVVLDICLQWLCVLSSTPILQCMVLNGIQSEIKRAHAETRYFFLS